MVRRGTDPGHGDGLCVPRAVVDGHLREVHRMAARIRELEARRADTQAGWERATEPQRRVRMAAARVAAAVVAPAGDVEARVSAVLDAAVPLAEWMASGRRPPTEAELAELRERFDVAVKNAQGRVEVLLPDRPDELADLRALRSRVRRLAAAWLDSNARNDRVCGQRLADAIVGSPDAADTPTQERIHDGQ